MDKEIEKKIKEAQKKQKEEQEKKLKAEDPDNKEFWEEKLKSLENVKRNLTGQLAEVDFAIECYSKKLDS